MQDPAGGDKVQSTATSELLAKLQTAPKLDAQRFVLEGELGQGGMGAVLRIHDRFLNRRLAMKVLLERAEPRDEHERRLVHQLLGRFLEEAQVTSQLDHPGVVPVHELGLDQNGKIWFTMRLVKGRTASEVFADSFAGRDDWPLTRALEVVLKVCDTMAYAHDKGVLHRDLKPSNVMVGRFGEVYVMDWGLAKVTGQPDRHDLRIQREASTVSQVDSVRRRDAAADTGSSVVSMDGQQLGTPSYMAPEQARSEELDQRADVYAIGAMLYELLTGRAPYTTPGVRQPAYRILNDVVDGPCKRIEQVQQGVPAELVAITEKAMARERGDRYPTVIALAADVRAFLAQRTVQAYRTGALVEMRLWVRRNRALAASIAAAVLFLLLGCFTTGTMMLTVVEQSIRYQAITEDYDQLGLVVSLRRLLAIEQELGPPRPADAERFQAWLGEARKLLHEAPAVSETIQRLHAEPQHSAEAGADGRRLLASSLADLIVEMPRLEALIPIVEKQQRWVSGMGTLTQSHPNATVTWSEARAAIAKADGVVASSLYAGQHIPLVDDDVWGLVPIGMNPRSKLWEFYDLRSAWDDKHDPASLTIPHLDADGWTEVTEATGVVLVLIPGGTLPAGLVLQDGTRDSRESVRLDPYLLGKFEVSQGQWLRWTGQNPSPTSDEEQPLALPANGADWTRTLAALQAHGWSLPTELQWEHAIRGGTTSQWWFGDDGLLAGDKENLGPKGKLLPCGSREPNPFGLFDMGGNVKEWCLDSFDDYGTERPGDGLRPDRRVDGERCIRGGDSQNWPSHAKSGWRLAFNARLAIGIGARASRTLTR